LDFSPHSHQPIPVDDMSGSAFAIDGSVRFSLSSSVTRRQLLLVTNTGQSGSVAMVIDDATTPAMSVRSIPLLETGHTSGGPTTGRAMRAGFELCNMSPQQDLQGAVYVLQVDARFALPAAPVDLTGLQVGAWMDRILAHDDVKLYNAAHFATARTFSCLPANPTDYKDFRLWNGGDTDTEFLQHLATWSGLTGPDGHHPMSTLAVVFETVTTPQPFVVKATGQYYTRWPLDTIGSSAEKPIPYASTDVIVTSSKAADPHTGRLSKVLDVASQLASLHPSIGHKAMHGRRMIRDNLGTR